MAQKSQRSDPRLKPKIARLILQRRKRFQQEVLAQAKFKVQGVR